MGVVDHASPRQRESLQRCYMPDASMRTALISPLRYAASYSGTTF
ncbi:hypothetical protein PD5205_00533 [Xanthomonas fragariae]|uniref:Uncharacterized protein n=1 Tax=Xanthomonas fragariae TaxID=48664 RepID=A0A1Y6HB13_9XANT|nr:hypothetical protein NBC2815_03483 [Xanthomonas fragariae]SMR00698.1 hypothetical protein PD885_03477 [Xanthomonas fragariae]SMR01853.1 hypothetical protein PD5205_00533 [Xanthomonas fragariae]